MPNTLKRFENISAISAALMTVGIKYTVLKNPEPFIFLLSKTARTSASGSSIGSFITANCSVVSHVPQYTLSLNAFTKFSMPTKTVFDGMPS